MYIIQISVGFDKTTGGGIFNFLDLPNYNLSYISNKEYNLFMVL